MFVEGRSWRYEHLKPSFPDTEGQPPGYSSYEFVLRVEGEDFFDGRQCKKIVCEGQHEKIVCGQYETSLYGYGYEDGDKVMLYALFNDYAFYAPFPTEQWVTLYDFGVAKDNHCQMGAFLCNDMIVSDVGTVGIEGVAHRYWVFRDAGFPTWPVWYAVEGIGSSYGLFEFDNLITDGSGSRYLGCYDGEELLFSVDDFADLTPSDVININFEVGYKNKSNYYDLQGRQLKSLPSKGVYIQNGKKVVVK